MHLSDGTQVDLSAQVAKVKARTRPWKAIIALILAIGAAAASSWAHNGFHHFLSGQNIPYQVMAIGLALAFCAFASMATIGLAGKAREVLEPRAGTAHAAIVRYALLLIGATTTLLITLGLLGVPIEQLVVGGALTSVFIGIAAQQSLSNMFAGLVLMLARPFRAGDSIRMQAGALGGQISGNIVEVGITYVRLATATGVISIPNSQVLNAVVGPLPDPGTDNIPEPTPPLMALPAGPPLGAPPPAGPPPGAPSPLMADRGQPTSGQPAGGHGSAGDDRSGGQPEVPAGTPEPRPSGTAT